ncbi:hypothetical protein UFOVP703_8 [uncultured Caudovirales phage]|uniref:Uncharacterized protein n=1 Tax=uncultured Caudovirales phage TaxID=2100421 RepID=A0A6J5NHH5_9CAUD|nr:hypothetical protein UFOVP703_8 [uncultured Caudovirales phage]
MGQPVIAGLLTRLLCAIGLHGPAVFRDRSCERNSAIVGGMRRCLHCRARWRRVRSKWTKVDKLWS